MITLQPELNKSQRGVWYKKRQGHCSLQVKMKLCLSNLFQRERVRFSENEGGRKKGGAGEGARR